MQSRLRTILGDATAILVAIVFVIVIGVSIQVARRNHSIDVIQRSSQEAKEAAKDAKKAAEEAERVLTEAIKAQRSSPLNVQAVIDALAAIHRIEATLNQVNQRLSTTGGR